ncbi:MarR family winged helix-turn-helix transcriptional regulator [Umboniibacter marinipuniceus]|uniref:MarR family transcriptional regulator n=1 Tax=Umboniibacter marinipuniceus TaxID=569599 RepID=A0A3M0AA09_9GAMM|nr:MarR family transcriptional regulator [Umboniibacter marinipuniceus]RMA81124.1 MarR family transcriptional regulator [Umboniibacter marinipuniceus]
MELAQFLPYRLSVLSNVVSNAISEYYADRFNLSISGWRVIALLAQKPGSTAVDLASMTQMDKVAISRAVSSLVQMGYIEREPCTIDRRRAYLTLTDKGIEIYNDIVPVAQSYEEKLLASLSETKRKQLDNLIAELQCNANTLTKSV